METICKQAIQYSDNNKEIRSSITALVVLLQQEVSEHSVETVGLRNLLRRTDPRNEFERPSLRLDPVQELALKQEIDNAQQDAALSIKKVWNSFNRYLNVAARDYNGAGSRGSAKDPISVMSDEVAHLWRDQYVPWYNKAKRTWIARSGINEAEVTLSIVVEGTYPSELDKRYRLTDGRSLLALQRQLANFGR
jgi:hypothetical protein